MGSEEIPLGFHPPQQARSRAALQKILTAAEQELAVTGYDDFTMTAVAERAGLSIGAIYGRFAGKKELLSAVKNTLLTRVEEDLAAAVQAAEGGLPGIVGAFTRTLADGFSTGAHVLPYVLGHSHNPATAERAHRALATIERVFLDAAGRHLDEVRQPDPQTALRIAVRTITGSCIHRMLALHVWPDGVSWPRWADEVSTMVTGYLTAGRP